MMLIKDDQKFSNTTTVADTGGLQWCKLKPHLLKIACTPNLFMTCHVSDKITKSYIVYYIRTFSTGETPYFVFEITITAFISR